MSQDEVLRCIINLGGSAWYDDLTNEYNKIHFPRNTDYRELDTNTVKKTLQGDISKLLRDNLISRIYKYPQQSDKDKPNRKSAYYSITKFGIDYIKRYKICQSIILNK